MFTKVLIANRGEIAVRIIRACREFGVSPVTVHSTADNNALHTIISDESVCIGPPATKDSYLNADAIYWHNGKDTIALTGAGVGGVAVLGE